MRDLTGRGERLSAQKWAKKCQKSERAGEGDSTRSRKHRRRDFYITPAALVWLRADYGFGHGRLLK